jgi:hypothetical protein
MKEYKLYTVIANYKEIQYFYEDEGLDIDENPHFHIFIIDGDGLVYEISQQCYESEIEDIVIDFCECDW